MILPDDIKKIIVDNYIDIAKELIKGSLHGIEIDGYNISVLPFSDDISIIKERSLMVFERIYIDRIINIQNILSCQ